MTKQRIFIAVGLFLGLVVLAVGLFALLHRRVVFPHRGEAGPPVVEGATVLRAEFEGGSVPVALWPGEGPLAVWWHGSGETIDNQANFRHRFTDQGFAFAAAEYPGFGAAEGVGPTEESILAAARAALTALAGQDLPQPVCVGASFGTGVAVAMAAEGYCSALILGSAFSSLPAVFGDKVPGLGLLIADEFDSLSRAPDVGVAALVLHGRQDRLVPFAHGEAVAQALPQATFLARDKGHMDLFDEESWSAVLTFVEEQGAWPPEGARTAELEAAPEVTVEVVAEE